MTIQGRSGELRHRKPIHGPPSHDGAAGLDRSGNPLSGAMEEGGETLISRQLQPLFRRFPSPPEVQKLFAQVQHAFYLLNRLIRR